MGREDKEIIPSFLSPTTIPENFHLEEYLKDIEKNFIASALKQAGGVKQKAAEILGLSFRQFRYKAKKYGF
jgi:two-component system response regulator PilR (NtrC family)